MRQLKSELEYSPNIRVLDASTTADAVFTTFVRIARERQRVSDEHFSVDSTLIEARARLKNFGTKENQIGAGAGISWETFHGENRSNPDASDHNR